MDATSATSLAALETLATEAWRLEPVTPHERKGVLRDEAAQLVDGLLARVARGEGALEVAMGERLGALASGGVHRLGFSGVGDYAYERLGIAAGTALGMARLARDLHERPLLREAVRQGDVSARKAQVIVPVARGDAEAGWVERARGETVRALASAVHAERGAAGTPEREEVSERVGFSIRPDARAKVDEALALAGRLLGATAPVWQRVEVLCAEYLGAHAVDLDEDEASARGVSSDPVDDWLPAARAALEEETEHWAALERLEPVAAPAGADPAADAFRHDAELRELGAMRARWDETLGHLAMLLCQLGLWREMGFADLGQYCAERLGMAESTVRQRAALERRLYALPSLRAALRAGRVSYEQARLVARAAEDDAAVEGWVTRAAATTCIALRRELDAREEVQMCERGEWQARMPWRIVLLLAAAFRAVREAEGGWLAPGECLGRVAAHFVETWGPALRGRRTVQRAALERDGGLCQVPACSRPAVHAHHYHPRARGGPDVGWNLGALCLVHHLRCVHGGTVRVRGRAPDGSRWELGVRPGLPPLAVFGPAERTEPGAPPS